MLAPIIVNSLADNTISGDGLTTLREAINAANQLPDHDIIKFDPAVFNIPKTITLTQGELSISQSVTIDGRDSSDNSLNITIDADGNSRIFGIGGGDVEINSLTLTGGHANRGGAIDSSNANLTIRNSTITGNSVVNYGGGIASEKGNLFLENSMISNNSANSSGGISFSTGQESDATGDLEIRSSTITGNHSNSSSGGLFIYSKGKSVTIDQSVVSGNEIDSTDYDTGGGLFVYGLNSDIAITDTTISNNKALGQSNIGGAFLKVSYGSNVVLDGLKIVENHADDDTGGLYIRNDASTVTVRNTTISGNTATHNSGQPIPFYYYGYDSSSGASVVNMQGGISLIENSTIVDNRTLTTPGQPRENVWGAGLFLASYYGTTTTVRNTTISGNQAEGSGGGIKVSEMIQGGSVVIEHSTITNNRADYDGDSEGTGGGIHVGNSTTTVTLNHTIVADNFQGTSTTRSDIVGSVTANWSLIGVNTGATISGANNLVGTSGSPRDPGLAPLADNGGPTLTHRPIVGSDAIDAGNPNISSPPAYDQRGTPFSRVVDGDGNSVARIDIGAVEFDTALPPKVTNVTISSWSATNPHPPHSFNDPNNEAGDFDGSGVQLKTVPVGNADTVSITFSEDVNVVASDLKFYGLFFATQPLLESLNPFSYDNNTFTATWKFAAPLAANQYLISLSDSVANTGGTPLDGEWVNPQSVTSTNSSGLITVFPSGNGIAGGDFNFVFTILPGDADLTNTVGGRDFLIWQRNFGGPGRTFPQADFNGDGFTDALDLAFYQLNYGLNLSVLRIAADFDGDGDVDAMDLALWQANHGTGTTHGEGDADGDGDVDGRDFLIWQRQFGIKIKVAV